ncbi:hypothetical protein SDC9_154432 [bioreactor metagenome]|uniref:Uncharacterized protein n=1 Tax=bioreactor metagenome TaxID=1076179 RepID=A0A645F0G2_9ZZZZ
MGDAPPGLLPQLGASGLVVDARVVRVGELVEHAALALLDHGVGEVAGVLHAPALGRQDEFGAKGLHGLGTLDGQVLGHDQHHAVALDGRRHGQRDAGIAGSRLDQRVARLDVAARFGALDHRQRRAVLDRAGRVVAFELGQDDIAAAFVINAGDTHQAHQRRVSDKILQGFIHGDAATRYIGRRLPPPWPSALRSRLRAVWSDRPA